MFSDRLDHLPHRKRRELQRVAQILFDEFEEALKGKLKPERKGGRIVRLVLFGSYARGGWVEDYKGGYFSDYDLLVVVNAEAFADFEFWERAEDRLDREYLVTGHLKTPVNFIVHSLQDVNDKLARGRPFFIDIVRDGIVLYEAPGFALATPGPLTPEAASAEAQAYFDEYFPLSLHSIKLAQISIADGVFRHAAFLLHQATERLYHCVLLVLTLYSPKLHRLTKLRPLAESVDARLIEVWPRDSRFARRAFSRLNRAYVDARYSLHYTITAEELAWLTERIERLQTVVAEVCRERLAR